jgi:hypothetical protein
VGVDLESSRAQQCHGAPRGGDVVTAPARRQHGVGKTLDAELDLRDAQPPQAQALRLGHMIWPCLHGQPYTTAGRSLVPPLRFAQRCGVGPLALVEQPALELRAEHTPYTSVVPRPGDRAGLLGERSITRRGCARRATPIDIGAEITQRLETAGRKPRLIALRIERPRAAQHDELHLVDRVPHGAIRGEPVPGLQVRIEAVVLCALGTGLVGQVALGHAHVARAERAGARAREGLGEHRDGRDARERPHGPQPQPRHELGLGETAVARAEAAEAGDDVALREESRSALRVAFDDAVEAARIEALGGRDVADDGAELARPGRGIEGLAMSPRLHATPRSPLL